MGVQTSYNFKTPAGVAGGLYDLRESVIDSRLNEENDGVLKFGMGVVKGTSDNQVKKPVAASTALNFVGVTVNGFTTQQSMSGEIALANDVAVGVLRKGRIWARCVADITVNVGDAVYLVVSGDNAGCFTNVASTNVKLYGCYFAGAKGTSDLYPIDIDVNAVYAGKLADN